MIEPAERVALAPFTTLELGGPAEYFVRASSREEILDALRWARARGLPVNVLGGGSNVVIADAGLPGLTLRVDTRGVRSTRVGEHVEVEVEAGEPWDALVGRTVAEGWAGLECLSGIPGLTGATPIQNVGAYGQEVAETIERVELLDRDSLSVVTRTREQCKFGYRSSIFKHEPERQIVLSVTFALRPAGAPSVKYAELARALGHRQPTLQETRETVLRLRRAKSMVLDAADENRRSVGSFFLNPVLTDAQVMSLRGRVAVEPPVFAADGGSKVPAAWLIERAGLRKGQRSGAVGLSSKHALSIVHHGGGTTAELVAFARHIRDQVRMHLGVNLEPEARLLGVTW
ncbi:MAG TPA: UDP-N-acetylmuramate dehydrogenase [Polyangiales bacterium]|nr:UDP-N-acetylmuramate dehydrogenase [Polyangiales bacterium]